MAESEIGNDLQETLKPFYQRASQAEDRLSRLEAALASKKDTGNVEHLKTINELQSKLEDAHAQLISEREEGRKLAAENAKLQYRIHHLVRAVRESDQKMEH
ncbi:uncharacterized protein LOC107431605 [Ziziphus jujuba]|uniref:Uncharacterized protein LOC107431605 n=1 Tax=Ziziphus jujuba TaxID=326968 RepID=A0A6P4AJX2_ZIZJJ|nr:uncharacterized protein LOC107431605 [Ziziphus jujuba]